jgi:hypothetical protein
MSIGGAGVSAGGNGGGIDLNTVLQIVSGGDSFRTRLAELQDAAAQARIAQQERAAFEAEKAKLAEDRAALDRARTEVEAQKQRFDAFWQRIKLLDEEK